MVIYPRVDADFTLPLNNAIKMDQLQVEQANKQDNSILTMFGVLELDPESLYRVPWGNRHVLGIPKEDKHLQSRLKVCVHMGGRAHRETAATIHALRLYYVWGSTEVDMATLIKECLHTMDDKVGTLKLSPLREVAHGPEVREMMHFEFLHIGTGGRWGTTALTMRPTGTHLLVLGKGVSDFKLLKPAAACTTAVTVKALLLWCAAMEVPNFCVNNTIDTSKI